MNRDNYGDIDRTFFDLSVGCLLTINDLSVVTLDYMYKSIDISVYDIDDNKAMYISISDIFDETEFEEEYCSLSFIDESYG